MYQIPLSSVPNQSIAFNVDGAYWQLHVYQAITHMCADVTRNGTPIANGVRCFGGIPVMPYSYMFAPDFGNFVFDSDADWTAFGAACNLYYLSASEFTQYQSLQSAAALIPIVQNMALLDSTGNPFILDQSILS